MRGAAHLQSMSPIRCSETISLAVGSPAARMQKRMGTHVCSSSFPTFRPTSPLRKRHSVTTSTAEIERVLLQTSLQCSTRITLHGKGPALAYGKDTCLFVLTQFEVDRVGNSSHAHSGSSDSIV